MARLGLGILFATGLLSLLDARGSARFRNPHVLTEPSVWLVDALMLIVFVLLIGALASATVGPRLVRRWQVSAALALGGTIAVAGAVGQLVYGAVWGFPLADLVWCFDIGMLAAELLASALAVVLGTPGCEIGVWPELIPRLRGKPSAAVSGLACIIGLHLLDNWEERHLCNSDLGRFSRARVMEHQPERRGRP